MANGRINRQEQRHQDLQIKERLNHIKNKILVMSGKGGVGKSSIAAYLSVALAKKGYRVGLMDVDLHGPSIPHILGLKGDIGPGSMDGKARPVNYIQNMDVISIESLLGENKDAATIWRGPLKIGVIRQFIADVEWPDLDYMIIDSPPGTGDEPLTVAQTIPDAKAIIVTTPQEISLADVRKSINFCRQVHMEILGLIENMSGLECPHCGKMIEIFKTRGGMFTAKKEGLRLLGTLPFEPVVVAMGDMGNVGLLDDSKLLLTEAFNKIVDEIIQMTKIEAKTIPEHKEQVSIREKLYEDSKILVIPISEGKLSSHFGHCKQFAFIEIQNGKIAKTEMLIPPAHEPGVLPQWLSEQGVDIVIAAGMGERAQQLLEKSGIEVITGAPMDSPASLTKRYLSGTLATGTNVCDH